jgi:malonyl-CoA O-methyltransferase
MGITLDNTRIARAFLKSLKTYDTQASVQQGMARDLMAELKAHSPGQLDSVLELGCGTGQLTERMLSSFRIAHYVANDLVPEFRVPIGRTLDEHRKTNGSFLAGDMEALSCFPDNLSLIVSGATFQWLKDIKGFVARMSRHLAPEGILAFSTFGPDNCKEISALTGLGLAYPTLAELKGYLNGTYQILVAHESHETRFFDTSMEVLRHLKATGVNGMVRHRWTPKGLKKFCEDYTTAYQQKAGIPLTYHPILVVARKK